MTEYFGDGDRVSFAAASIYPQEPLAAPEPPRQHRRCALDFASENLGPPITSAARPRRYPHAPPPDDDDAVDALDIPTVCRRSGLGRSYVYEEIRRGALRARKFGRLTRILRQDYEAWLAAAPLIAPSIGDDGTPPPASVMARHTQRGRGR
jgi:excisionase family DNA binding protein